MRILKIALLVLFATSTLLGTASSVSAFTRCVPKNVFQDDHPSGGFFSYTQDWTHLSEYIHGGEPLEKTISFTNTPADVFMLPLGGYFFGNEGIVTFDIACSSSFEFVHQKSPNLGIADIYVYNNSWSYLTSVDQYAPQVQWQASTTILLPVGTTEVAIINSGRKHPSATDMYINLDGITPR